MRIALRNLYNKKFILLYELTLTFVAVVAIFGFVHIFLPVDRAASTPIVFRVENGEGSYQTAFNLEKANLIRSRTSFFLYALLIGQAQKLQSGDYLFAPSMNAHTIIHALASGDIIREYITIKEGWNLRDIATEFEKRGFFTQEEFFAVTGYPTVDYREETDLPRPKDFSREFAFLQDKPLYVSLEGYLFPDTYQVTANETAETFVRHALRNFGANLTPELLYKIEAQGKSIYEVVTWAAMIEKEVRNFEDKQLVAGLLQKRLEEGMRLQTDSPVVYIRDGNYYKVSIAETQIESPYNTYRIYGLPLGPISNPGIESIQAAVEPVASPYWYYLSARDGATIFSRTFAEHLAAKALYLR
ncbi:MAG: hypothetical protein A2940_01260 [Candidatus Wildermuthbacteria bacterium RIFCSPLOWO2_01_FULL_48_29]|uniref:Endolytic murein transglycosylase n=2 Tax=Candidatus Wildermuthiibacteriota TaxID=1817923 RepID=A0A1G2RKG1_9BACT|nr:MAG: hypothetical protein A2843_01935 [Candidatus Wildermuthbacteria bacterium RIFCSPHIGHO2_01_FULL_48_27b]OHA73334.1 MAG: hypothetical protein A2940_01260 [Candidatus Wildermuthbacteria bacterium RIFCSPLOWO2_01_FULL_48_29]